MTAYCSLTALKTYLDVTVSTDDALMQSMLDASASRIDARCGRVFSAAADSTRYFDVSRDILRDELWLDGDLSHITSVVNGDGANITSGIYANPRNVTPYYSLGIKTSSSAFWTYANDVQNAISVTGRWAYMSSFAITTIVRSSNIVQAVCSIPDLSVGASIFIVGVSDTSFNGTFTVTSNSGAIITWAQTASNASDATGYALCVPTDISQACKRLAAWLYRQKDTQQGDADRPIIAGDGTVIMPTTLPQDVEKMLLPYTRAIR